MVEGSSTVLGLAGALWRSLKCWRRRFESKQGLQAKFVFLHVDHDVDTGDHEQLVLCVQCKNTDAPDRPCA